MLHGIPLKVEERERLFDELNSNNNQGQVKIINPIKPYYVDFNDPIRF